MTHVHMTSVLQRETITYERFAESSWYGSRYIAAARHCMDASVSEQVRHTYVENFIR